jgi:serine/threonine protein kinase
MTQDSTEHSNCPDETTLQDFLAGRLSGSEAQALEGHVEQCSRCELMLERFQPPGGPLGVLAGTCVSVPVVEETPRVHGYDIRDRLGAGGMGEVYRARHAGLSRVLAIKVLHPNLTGDSQARQRFLEEAHIHGQLQHPSIVPLHELGTTADDRPFFAMKLIEGRTLENILTEFARHQNGAPDRLQATLPLFARVCQGVAYAHSHRVIHRDLKPGNVMVGAFGEVQVMDWGLAKVLSSAPVIADGETDTGDRGTIHTPPYASS